MKYIIGTDLDGTLLTSEKRITNKTRKAVEEAVNSGNIVVPVTGRPFGGLPEDLCDISGIKYVITSNGAVTYNVAENKILKYYGMPVCIVEQIYNIVSEFDVIFEVFKNGYGYTDEKSFAKLMRKYEGTVVKKYLQKSRKSIKSIPGFLKATRCDIDGISVMFKNDCDYADVRSELKSIRNVNIIENSQKDIEVNHILADKGRAFSDLAVYLNIPSENTVAIGDGSNDYGLLKSAGYSVAMGNAKDCIKEIADFITGDNDSDGVAEVLNNIVLKDIKKRGCR